ncbi:nucleotide exchange factor GrpE [Clostridium polynesiense]|uniref:nucleotide exchange factor GrpE n=1 Tax=Clostridium polynesiense TaxID=1325933 RepID=UPI000693C66C|nr:nucleotide exchange factor GrpE [Clostridium polynesiense]
MEEINKNKNINNDEEIPSEKEEININEDEKKEANNGESWQQEEVLEDSEFEEVNEDDNLISINKNLKDENNKLKSEINALKDRLLRLNAEYDNYRKRTVKEKEGIYTDAVEDVLKTLLPVLDNLERAVSVDGDVEDLKKGVELTIKQFQDSLEKLGVEEVDTDNGFDPNFHEAVMHIEDDTYGENVVAEVFQKGYKKGSKVIRYSIVKVAN